jgi:hypothetical protein
VDGRTGHHQENLILTDLKKLTIWAKFLNYRHTTYQQSTVIFPKLAILAIYLRIFSKKSCRAACYVVAGILIGNWLGTTIAGFFMCIPFNFLWDRTIPGGHCFSINSYFRWASLANIITDVVMLVLPLPVIWKIQTTTNTKIGLTITFATGSL